MACYIVHASMDCRRSVACVGQQLTVFLPRNKWLCLFVLWGPALSGASLSVITIELFAGSLSQPYVT